MYAIRSYYVLAELHGFFRRGHHLFEGAAAFHLANLLREVADDGLLAAARITSYNVCDTKLLRIDVY